MANRKGWLSDGKRLDSLGFSEPTPSISGRRGTACGRKRIEPLDCAGPAALLRAAVENTKGPIRPS